MWNSNDNDDEVETIFDDQLSVPHDDYLQEGLLTAQNRSVRLDEDAKFTTGMGSRDKPFLYSLYFLIGRSYYNLLRQPAMTSGRISQGLFFGLILCLFYAPLGGSYDYIQNIIGALYLSTSLCFIGMLGCIAVFPLERDVFLRFVL